MLRLAPPVPLLLRPDFGLDLQPAGVSACDIGRVFLLRNNPFQSQLLHLPIKLFPVVVALNVVDGQAVLRNVL